MNEGNDDGAAAQQQRRSPHLRFLSAQRPKDGKISHLMVKRLVGCLRHSKTSLFQRIGYDLIETCDGVVRTYGVFGRRIERQKVGYLFSGKISSSRPQRDNEGAQACQREISPDILTAPQTSQRQKEKRPSGVPARQREQLPHVGGVVRSEHRHLELHREHE